MEQQYYSVAQVAAELGLSDRHVRHLIRKNPEWRVRISDRAQLIPRSALAAMRRRWKKQVSSH